MACNLSTCFKSKGNKLRGAGSEVNSTADTCKQGTTLVCAPFPYPEKNLSPPVCRLRPNSDSALSRPTHT